MNGISALARRYPVVAVTVLVGLVTVGLLISERATAAQWLASGFGLIIALQTSIRMIKDLLRGHWGVDVLAVMAIVSTVAVGEYLAALVIVLMLSGGEALDAFGYIPAIAGAATQEVVDLITILNALRARSAGRGGRNVSGPPMAGTPAKGRRSVVRSR